MVQKIRHLLATDLDGTFVGDEEGLRDLLRHYESLPEPVSLAYVTGRHRASADELIREEGLPRPDLLITDVGTAIYSGADLLEDEGWQDRMTADWRPDEVAEAAAGIPGLSRQALPGNRRVSFCSDGPAPAEALHERLDEAGIPHTFVFSSGRDVDSLPAGGGKGEALRYAVGKYAAAKADILVAGDSGNDLDMLMAGYPAVIVSNARPELAGIGAGERLFRATRPCAGGILEAWQHFYGKPR